MPDDQLYKPPEAYGYEFQSGGVVDMLGKLRAQFGSKKHDLDNEELNAQHSFELLMQQLADNVANAEHEVGKKSAERAEAEQAKADAQGELAQGSSDLKEDETYLSDLTALCDSKKADYGRRSKLRTEELATIQEAIKVISSEAVAGAGEKHLPVLAQLKASVAPSLTQLRNGVVVNPVQAQIASFLSDRARQLNSHLLSLLSQRVAADPFTKVKKLIKDLIWKLMEEATAETEHKGWCDTEVGTNKQTREARGQAVNKLTADVEELSALIAKLAQECADLAAALAELSAAVQKASEERAESKATNEETIRDAKGAQEAVEGAMRMLKDYYGAAAESTASLLQQGARERAKQSARQSPMEEAPETFDSPYKGLVPESGNVLDFMEVILADFTKLESETTSAESTEAAEHKKFLFAAEKDKALKENEMGHKSDKKVDTEQALHATQQELKATQEQLDAAIAYYDKLKPICIDTGITYEDRVKRREEEIQSLKEALQILSGSLIG